MSNDDDLRINSAERFQKAEKSRLLLEEHSHCEVPAGCGGVVLRWVDPAAGLPIVLGVRAPTPLEVYLDGERVDSARITVSFGEHLLALGFSAAEVEAEEPVPPLLLCGAQHDERGGDERRPVAALLSRADGSWRVTRSAPAGDGWRRDLAFDDGDWEPLRSTKLASVPTQSAWAYEQLSTLGAVPLALPPRPAGALWLRKRFRLDAPR